MCLHGGPNFCVNPIFGTLGGTTIFEMDSKAIHNIELEDLPEDHKILITQAVEEYTAKYHAVLWENS